MGLLPEELNWPAVAERPLSLLSELQWLLAAIGWLHSPSGIVHLDMI